MFLITSFFIVFLPVFFLHSPAKLLQYNYRKIIVLKNPCVFPSSSSFKAGVFLYPLANPEGKPPDKAKNQLMRIKNQGWERRERGKSDITQP